MTVASEIVISGGRKAASSAARLFALLVLPEWSGKLPRTHCRCTRAGSRRRTDQLLNLLVSYGKRSSAAAVWVEFFSLV